jgi:hypothetical protein
MAAGGRLPPDPQEGELYAKARRRRLSDCQNGKGHKHDASGEKSLDPDWWMIALTAGLVLVGGGQVWVLIRQTNILKQQAKYMKSVLRPRLSRLLSHDFMN